jgi:hypothetical protein
MHTSLYLEKAMALEKMQQGKLFYSITDTKTAWLSVAE